MVDVIDGEASHDTEADSGNIEAEARKMGWVPEAEFKGERKPRRFKTAQEFVDDTESISPHFKRLLADKDKEYEARFDRLGKVLKRQYEADLSEITVAQKAAAKDGDDAEFDRLEAEKTKLIKQGPEASEQSPDEEFQKRNEWYGSDTRLTAMARGISQTIMADYHKKNNRIMPQDEMFKAVEDEVKASADYREKYGKTTQRHASVDGGGENGGDPPRKRGKGWGDLPPEAKRAWNGYDARIKKSLTQDKFADQYWSDPS